MTQVMMMMIPFSTEPRGYLYDPEYQDAELCQLELERAEGERRDREVTS